MDSSQSQSQREDAARSDALIARWRDREGGQERANYGLFLIEFCDALGLPRPEPAGIDGNDYVFERAVKKTDRDGAASHPRIDLYKRGCFILEAKQSRLKGARKEVLGQLSLPDLPTPNQGRRGADRAWDVLMVNARQQAEAYVPLLPVGHEPPPFLIVCDVGHCFEVYANFRRDGKVYDQFPDRRGFRIEIDDLRRPDVRDRLRLIWTDPLSLDPARHAARVTRAIAERLAAVSKSLEAGGHGAEEVALFLMRCLFTMFTEDVGLLHEAAFKTVLERCEADPAKFEPMVGQLWEAMDEGGFAHALETRVRKFNGTFFKQRDVLPLGREEIGELRRAASHDWRDVDPSIFGALLEQALDPRDRRRLGAHYTPRPYVERLVVATVIEPLRSDWLAAYATAERQKAEGRPEEACRSVAAFHDRLCVTRILDPACGTGNFLYVTLELMKRLEGEVLEALAALGGQEALSGLEGHTVGPHQFLGLEINPRAAAIAELVLWIGHLQWHLRTRGGLPDDPILKAFRNIVIKDAVLEADEVPVLDAAGRPVTRRGPDGVPVEVCEYRNPRRPEWPPAEFIVGNPPFMGKGESMREALGDDYLEGLFQANRHVERSADLVMNWWDRAADILKEKSSLLRRFGFITTNSIAQVFNRRVVQRHCEGPGALSLVWVVPDHPWRGATRDTAVVRIAMTVCEIGRAEGVLRRVVGQSDLDADAPLVRFIDRTGRVNPDLTIGADLTLATPLRSNLKLASMGPALGGRGFILTRTQAIDFHESFPDPCLRPLTTGNDITGRHRRRFAIDVGRFETEEQLRRGRPGLYQHLRQSVYPQRRSNPDPRLRSGWWKYRRSNVTYFNAIAGLDRYVATVETAKHRLFVRVDGDVLVEHGVIGFGLADAWQFGVLSSTPHRTWALGAGGTLESRPRYNKDLCFDPFPFPAADELQRQRIRVVADELDAHRKRVLAEHAHLTLTGLYNVLERLRAGIAPADLAAAERRTFDDGLVLILGELHDRLDLAVADAYGWPVGLPDDEILSRLVALNRERAAEEARGLVRWLRPDYQIPRFGSTDEKAELDLVGGADRAAAVAGPKAPYPADDAAQTAVVMAALARASGALDAGAIAARFRQGRRVAPKVAAVLLSLYRMGLVGTADGGASFALQRAAEDRRAVDDRVAADGRGAFSPPEIRRPASRDAAPRPALFELLAGFRSYRRRKALW